MSFHEYQTEFWRNSDSGEWIVKGDWTWDHFHPREVACRCGHHDERNPHIVNNKAMDALEMLRHQVGGPIRINSAYRCKKYNQQIGGADKSYHLTGRAFDIPFNDLAIYGIGSLVKLVSRATECGFHGFGVYDASEFIHLDTGPLRAWEQAGSFFDDFGIET